MRAVRPIFPRADSLVVEHAQGGRLPVVYRVSVDERCFYLRVAEQPDDDLTTDAQLLDGLRALGARVPAVVHVEVDPADLDRSFLVMTEVGGQSLGKTPLTADVRGVARAAGRDAALINSVVVQGFGRLIRDG
ncbi:MAG: phosphotransferase, partial [Acidimicrobiaceae bacterium]|nr:phosphotransferase [Acidimicrobiaceae bacterium]